MTPETVMEYLKSYKQCMGRCAHLEIAIREAELRFRRMGPDMEDAMAYHVQQYENMDMPRGTDTSNPTQDIALRLGDIVCSEDLRDAWNEIGAMKVELAQKQITVHFVEAWLKGLSSREIWIINKQVFDGLSYREMIHLYRADFGESCSKDLLRRLRKDSLTKIYEMAE